MNLLMTTTGPASSLDPAAKVGVLMYHTTLEVDKVLAESIRLIRAHGMTVAGLLQRFGERLPNGKRSMWVEDVATGQTIRLDHQRGAEPAACMLDPDALARSACLLRRAAVSAADVIVVSRFGNAEADGSGLRAEIAEAICSGAAVIIPVRYSLLDDFEGFLGEPASLLLPAPMAIADWAEDVVLGINAANERAPL